MQVWDTTGSRIEGRFLTIILSYFRGTHVFLVFFDVTNRESFDVGVPFHLDLIDKQVRMDEVVIFLVATKCEVPAEERKVSTEEAVAFAKEKRFYYQETSAKTGAGVNQVFQTIAKHASTYGFPNGGVQVRPTPEPPKPTNNDDDDAGDLSVDDDKNKKKEKKEKGSYFPSLKNLFGKKKETNNINTSKLPEYRGGSQCEASK
jgi:small GTP-binding protein